MTSILRVGIFLYVALAVYLVHGARRVDVKKRLATGIEEWRSRRSSLDSNPSTTDVLRLEKGEGLEPAASISTKSGAKKTRYKETYHGIVIEDEVVVVEQDKSGEFTGEISGQLIEGIENELPTTKPDISALDALNIVLNKERDDYDNIIFNTGKNSKLVIRTEDTTDPDEVDCFLVWEINYKVKNKASRPFYVIDAMTGDIIESWQGIDSFPAKTIRKRFSRLKRKKDITRELDPEKPNDRSEYKKYVEFDEDDCETGYTKIGGIGGNIKNGMTVYGKDYKLLTVKKEDDICTMENENVQVIDIRDFEHLFPDYSNYTDEMWANSTPFAWDEIEYTPHKVDCEMGNDDEVNGGYSPLNDVYHFCNEVYRMYHEWFDIDPLSNMTIKAKVHYDMQNAYWDGEYVTFGDGGSYFHPLTSMDVVAHEIAHGFTEHHAGLIYNGESGGMNEAYSDMAGEAAEYFIGGNDWHIGKGIMVDHVALRFMDDPTKDNRSIANSVDYCPGIDVHLSSGVFNRAFYILSYQPGWNIRKAFEVFTIANMMYWTPHSTFPEGACGVASAAEDKGYDVYQVVETFRIVGVEPCQKRRSGLLPMYNLHGKAGGNVTFLWSVEGDVHNAQISLSDTYWRYDPDVDLYVNSKEYNLESAEVNVTKEKISISDPTDGPNQIVIHGRENFTKVVLTVVSDDELLERDLEYHTNVREHFQMPIDISSNKFSSESSVAVRITHTNSSSDAPYGLLMRYEEEVDTEDWLFDYWGKNEYDDDWNVIYSQVVMCKPQPGRWYVLIGGNFSDVDLSLHTVHFPLKLTQPGEKDVEGRHCW